MARIPDACQQFAVLHNDDLVITTKQGHIYHYDADGVERGGDDPSYVDAYVNHPQLHTGAECLGVYAIGRDRKCRANGHPEAMGYCQVLDDGNRYHWVR